MMRRIFALIWFWLIVIVGSHNYLHAQQPWQAEWDKTVAAAKKEGKVVVGLPPSAELRRELEPAFKARFGFEMEVFSATGPQIANRVVTEGRAGMRYFDAFIFGSCTGVPLIKTGLFDPAENYFILPEVKDIDLICALREKIPAFQGIKIEAARTGYKATVLRERTGGALQVWSGWAMPQMMEALDRGIHGFNPSAFHRRYLSVVERYFAGDRPRAAALFEATLPYLAWSRQHIDINLHLLKRFCVRKGLFRSAHLRPPFIPWDDYHERYASELIDRMLSWENLADREQQTREENQRE